MGEKGRPIAAGTARSSRTATQVDGKRGGAGGRAGEHADGYITTGGLFPDSFKQKAMACWMQ